MRVLMIAPEPYFEPRGTPISVLQRLRALSALGHQVDLLTYHVGQDVTVPGVAIHRIPAIPFIKRVAVGPSWAKPVLDVLLFLLTVLFLLRNRYDVIHSHEEAAFFCVPLSFLFRTKHYYDMHSSLPRQLRNFEFGNWWPLVKIFEAMEWLVLQSCDVVITVGADLDDVVQRINPKVRRVHIENTAFLDPAKECRPSGVDALKRSLNLEGKFLVVYVGTFAPYQGLELLLDGARRVIARGTNAHFVLVGAAPPQLDHWRQVVHEADLDKHITLVGIVQPDVAFEYMCMADVLVSPRTDGTSIPLKIYTYLTAGKATLATRIGAHTQILDDKTAYLVEPNGEAIAKGVLALHQSSQLRAGLGENARRYAQAHFQFDQYVARMVQVYQTGPEPDRSVSTGPAPV